MRSVYPAGRSFSNLKQEVQIMKRVVDFPDREVIDSEAAEWLIRLDDNTELSQEERDNLSKWANRSPAHRRRIRDLATAWSEMNVITELAVLLGKPRRRRFWNPNRSWIRLGLTAISATAMAACLVAIVYWYTPDPIRETNGFLATAIGEQTSAKLGDGSVVWLNTNTQIRIAYAQDSRDIHLLQGEAHFTVAENAEMPFRVFAGMGRIDAVGTAFLVYLRGDLVDVAVTAGRVELASTSGLPDRLQNTGTRNPVVNRLGALVAGQAATISPEPDEQTGTVGTLSDLRIVEDRDMSRIMSWREGILVFSGESLAEVAKEISRYTTVSIEFSDPEVQAIRLGGRFPVGETETMLTALEKDFGLQVTRVSANHIIISAESPR